MTTTVERTDVERIEHLHRRPEWDCRSCSQPWPCSNAKANMLAEFRAFPTVLSIYLTAQMYDALGDMTSRGEQPPPDLYERFVTWARNA